MSTMYRSFTWSYLKSACVVVALLFTFGLRSEAQAQMPCGASVSAPQCDGYCPPGQACVETLPALCECVPTAGPCGVMSGPPQCWGDCPPSMPVCVDNQGICECTVPTLSEWGIGIMSLAMFGGVLYLRRRRGVGRS